MATKVDDSVRALVDLRDRTFQKARIQFGNRVSAIEQGRDSVSPRAQAIIKKWEERFEDLEKEAEKDIKALVDQELIVLALCDLKGISFTLAAKVVCMIDISVADTVSSLWRYAGYGVASDGKRDRPISGEKLSYNKRLKTTLYLVGGSFLKCNSPYRAIYDTQKAYYEVYRPEWVQEKGGKAHIHAASMRKMIKVFLSHLWNVWRELEGLPTRPLYVHEKLKHTMVYDRKDFGWML